MDEYADPEEYEYDWTQSGCYGAAQHEVWESDEDEEFAGLQDEASRLWEQVAADPRVSALDAAWSSCMADAGHDGFDGPNEAAPKLSDEWNVIQGWDDPEYRALQESWDWAAEPDGPGEPERDEAAVRAFTDREIAIAVADAGCKAEVGYDDAFREINHEHQQEFVDRHRAELEAWAAAAERDD